MGLVAEMAEYKIDVNIGGTLQQRISSCLQVLDTLLNCSDPITSSMVVAEKKILKGATIVETVMNIMGLRDLKSISLEAKFSEIGMDSLMAVEMKQTLERDFGLSLTQQDLRSLTFQKLMDFTKSKPVESVDVKNFFILDHLYDDENVKKELFLFGDDCKKAQILFIPGIEGCLGKAVINVANQLDNQVFCLQFAMKAADSSNLEILVDSIFDSVFEQIFKAKERFLLVGYSFGGIIAMKIAHRLETLKNITGKVILIDSGIQIMQGLIDLCIPKGANCDMIRSFLLRQICSVTLGSSMTAEIEAIPTWDDKIAKLASLVTETFSPELVRLCVDAMYNNMKICQNLQVNSLNKLKSDILLIRPKTPSIPGLDEDYQVSQYTTGKFNMKVIEGDHVTILNNPELIEIINSETI